MQLKHWLTFISIAVCIVCFLFGGVYMSGACTIAIGAVVALMILAAKGQSAAPRLYWLFFGSKFRRLLLDVVITAAAFIVGGGAAGILTGLFVSTGLEWLDTGETNHVIEEQNS